MGLRARARGEDGQVIPLLLFVFVATIAIGMWLYQTAHTAVLRSDAQTGADAAALAGVRNVKEQLLEQLNTTGEQRIDLINDARVKAASAGYASKNGVTVTSFERLGVDVRVRVRTNASLGDDARPIDSVDTKGLARARATLGVGGAAGVSGGGGGGGGAAGCKPEKPYKDEEFEKLGKKIGAPPFNVDDIVEVGRFLQDHGLRVAENTHFGGVAPPPTHGQYGVNDHYHDGAVDVNSCIAEPHETPIFDELKPKLQKLHLQVLWRVPHHAPGDNSHMHVDIGPGGNGIGGPTGAGGGGGGLLGGDVVTEIHLVPWEGEPGGVLAGGAGNFLGPPDMKIACQIYTLTEDLHVSERVQLAAFEAALVESGIHNINFGDRDSLGIYQQRQNGAWGTAAQIMDPEHAIRAFLAAAKRNDSGGMSAGQLAQKTQVSAYPDRYDQRREQALDIMRRVKKGEGGCST